MKLKQPTPATMLVDRASPMSAGRVVLSSVSSQQLNNGHAACGWHVRPAPRPPQRRRRPERAPQHDWPPARAQQVTLAIRLNHRCCRQRRGPSAPESSLDARAGRLGATRLPESAPRLNSGSGPPGRACPGRAHAWVRWPPVGWRRHVRGPTHTCRQAHRGPRPLSTQHPSDCGPATRKHASNFARTCNTRQQECLQRI